MYECSFSMKRFWPSGVMHWLIMNSTCSRNTSCRESITWHIKFISQTGHQEACNLDVNDKKKYLHKKCNNIMPPNPFSPSIFLKSIRFCRVWRYLISKNTESTEVEVSKRWNWDRLQIHRIKPALDSMQGIVNWKRNRTTTWALNYRAIKLIKPRLHFRSRSYMLTSRHELWRDVSHMETV